MSTVKERVNNISRNDNLTVGMGPTTAKIELTGKCSLSCRFCFNKEMKKHGIRQNFMSTEDFQKAYSYVKSFPSMREIGLFYMGESGLHPNLKDFYKQVKDDGFFTFLTTNGTTTKNILPAIPYIDSLKVSWNYKNLEDFMAKTGLPAFMYHAISHNIKVLYQACHKNGKVLAISTVLDSAKEDYADAIKKLRHDEHYFIPLQTQGGSFSDGTDGVVGEADKPSSPLPCWSLFKGVYVDCNLNVRTCCYGHTDKHILGNLNDGSIATKEALQAAHLNGCVPDACHACLHENGAL